MVARTTSIGTAVLFTVLTLPAGLGAQAPSYEALGFLRRDGVVLPVLSYGSEGWKEIRLGDVGAWAEIPTYYYYDTLGVRSAVRTVQPIKVCCDAIGNDRWGHSTDYAAATSSDWSPTIGYVTSDSTDEAPFLPAPVRPDRGRFEQLVDSLLPLADSLTASFDVDVWQARLGTLSFAFFQVVRRGHGLASPCFVVVGWLLEGDPNEIRVQSSGDDDCDGKGHGRRRPWTLLRRDARIYVMLSRYLYDGGGPEIWKLVGSEWELHLAAPQYSY